MNAPQLAAATAIIIFSLGIWGVAKARDILRVLVAMILLLSSATLLAIALSQAQPDASVAAGTQAWVLIAWAVEVIEIILFLAIAIALGRHRIKDLSRLREYRW